LLFVASVLLLVVGCARAAMPPPQPPPTVAPSPTPSSTPIPTPTQAYITTFTREDCSFQIPGELRAITTVSGAEVDNEPKTNNERVFQRFYQGMSPSTILRCEMVTQEGGDELLTRWWIQSLESEQEAFDLFEGFIGATAPAVTENNRDEAACSQIFPESGEMTIRYTLTFRSRGICTGATVDGLSGLVWYRNNLIGIDSPFYQGLFDPIAFHAEAVIDREGK
ncbi:MAG: hypothetical protein V3U26_05785, partial [Dehalococcoidia bacterium]